MYTAPMALEWIHENPPRWDAGKQAVVASADAGIFDLPQHQEGDLIPAEWWRVADGDETVGYGWMDTTWADAEVLLAVSPDRRGTGVGTFILDRLAAEAATRGLRYLYNVVRDTHPHREALTRWLTARGFVPSSEGLLKRKVNT